MGRLSAALLGDNPFDGSTYERKHDHVRLKGQLERVFQLMRHGDWHTLAWLADAVNGTEASVSARLRDLRKPKFGSHIIDRRRVGTSGLFQYKLVERK